MSDTVKGKPVSIVDFSPQIISVYNALAKVTISAHELRDDILAAEKARGCKGGEDVDGLLGFMLAVNQAAKALGETILEMYGNDEGSSPIVR